MAGNGLILLNTYFLSEVPLSQAKYLLFDVDESCLFLSTVKIGSHNGAFYLGHDLLEDS